jgi:hypothetical protein
MMEPTELEEVKKDIQSAKDALAKATACLDKAEAEENSTDILYFRQELSECRGFLKILYQKEARLETSPQVVLIL